MKKNSSIFTLLVIINILILYLTNYALNEEALIIDNYKEIFGKENFEEILNLRKKWSWVSYAIIPLIIFIRTSLVSICLNIGLFFYDIENQINYKQIFKITLKSEYVLIFVGLFKIIFFYFIKTDFTLEELQNFYPLSYINLLDKANIEPWLIYPLQTINLFEILYFFMLVHNLNNILKNKYWKSFEIVVVSYGTGLFIWLILVMFMILNMS